MLVGRVLSVSGWSGQAEYTEKLVPGELIYYQVNGRKIICQVTNVSVRPLKGFYGTFKILDATAALPKIWANLYLLQEKIEGHVNIGTTEKGEPVKLRVNPFFRHVLIAGKTLRGKTHLQIVIHEEFLKCGIPSIIIDTQGEFPNLNKFNSNAIVCEEMRFSDLLSHLRYKKTVVFNLQGLSYSSKTRICFEILSQLMAAKERDYKEAENDVRLLQIPPVIVDIDETEIYAPEHGVKTMNKDCSDTLKDVAERGGKFGIGLLVNAQRAPALHFDVRAQCNSAMVFQLTDSGSRIVIGQLPYITNFDLRRIRDLPIGQCIITGEMVSHPIHVLVRDIETKRAKNLDFEDILGLESVLTPQVIEEETVEEAMPILTKASMAMEGVTYEKLQTLFPIRKIPAQGECVVIPERFFKPGWTNTLALQGCKVVHCPDMPGGSVYMVRKDPALQTAPNNPVVDHNSLKTRRKIKKMAKDFLKPPIQSS